MAHGFARKRIWLLSTQGRLQRHPCLTIWMEAPSTCSCVSKFSVEPTLSCAKGGYPSIRHNEIQDLTAHLMTEVCPNVALEPHLQPLTGERFSETTARIQPRLDEAADGFWGSRFERSLFDVRVFNPYAPLSRRLQLPAACYRTHKNIKRGHMTNESGR